MKFAQNDVLSVAFEKLLQKVAQKCFKNDLKLLQKVTHFIYIPGQIQKYQCPFWKHFEQTSSFRKYFLIWKLSCWFHW